jgi:hypothetical protein
MLSHQLNRGDGRRATMNFSVSDSKLDIPGTLFVEINFFRQDFIS